MKLRGELRSSIFLINIFPFRRQVPFTFHSDLLCFPWPVRFNSISTPLNGEPVPLTHRKGVAIVVSLNHTGAMVNGDYIVAVCLLIRLNRENMLNFQITQCYIYKDDFKKLVSV